MKGDSILIAAHNPFAKKGQKSSIVVHYKNWSDTIQLVGQEIFLCDFRWNNTNTSLPTEHDETQRLVIYPNPAASRRITIKTSQATKGDGGEIVSVYNLLGAKVAAVELTRGDKEILLNLQSQPKGIYQVVLENKEGEIVGIQKAVLN